MKIGLILDNPRRDLDGLMLLAYQLLKRKHTVFIIPFYDQSYDVPLLNLDVLIVNYARKSNLDFLKTAKKLGVFLVVMDTEGGVLPESGNFSPDFLAQSFNKMGGATLIEHYFFWGQRLYEAYSLHSGLSKEKLSVTGCPRYDYCHLKWRPLLGSADNSQILVNLNFPGINPWWGSTEYNKTFDEFIFHSARKETSDVAKMYGLSANLMLAMENEQKNAFKNFLLTIRKLAKLNKNKKIIVRPHPFENRDVYRVYFGDLSNVIVDSEGEVLSVINKSSLVIQLNCSTAVESRLLNKLPVSLEFLNSEALRNNLNLPSRISYPARSFEELIELIQNDIYQDTGCIKQKDVMKQLKPWFYKCDGNSSQRMAEIIDAFNYSNIFSDVAQQIFSSAQLFGKFKFHAALQGTLSLMFGSNLIALLRRKIQPSRQFKYSSVLTIKTRLEEIALCDGRQLRFQIEHARNRLTGLRLTTICCQP